MAFGSNDSDVQLLRHRFEDLARTSARQFRWAYSDFLSPADQSVLISMGHTLQPYLLYGGWDGAERRIACFGSEEELMYPPVPPVVWVRIAPKSAKFSGRMGHRDFLGSLMGLGIKRETLGDILIKDSSAWVLCYESISGYIIDQLERVGNTAVTCSLSEVPDVDVTLPKPSSLAAASDRVDALCAAVYDLSRTESKESIVKGLVFVDGRQVTDPSFKVNEGSLVNLRGKGRFIYNGAEGQTRSGRLRASVSIYK